MACQGVFKPSQLVFDCLDKATGLVQIGRFARRLYLGGHFLHGQRSDVARGALERMGLALDPGSVAIARSLLQRLDLAWGVFEEPAQDGPEDLLVATQSVEETRPVEDLL